MECIVRVEVVDDHFGHDREQRLVKVDFTSERLERPVVVEVAHVMADKRVVVTSECERVLQMSAHCEHGTAARASKIDRTRRIAA